MKISTNQPGLQFYTGNFLDGTPGSGGYPQNGALCLETQFFPDTPNQPEFPSSLLRPGQTYHHRTVHRFDVVDSPDDTPPPSKTSGSNP
jgi:aldose 1-epimerase